VNAREAVAVFRGHREPHLRIVEHRNWWFALSGTVIVLSLIGLFVRGLNLSIDFEGGSQITYPDRSGVSADDVRGVLEQPPYRLTGSEVQLIGGNEISIRTRSLTELSDTERTQLVDALAKQAGVTPNDVNRTDVGPTWGSEISRKALQGLIVVLLAITVYISFRFEWKMAIGAQVAMVHDVIITAGIYALVGREVTPATVIAILTILGYSLYDTVVIYDKIQENTESPALLARDTYTGIVDHSLNQVLMRSVNTSLVVLFPIVSLLLFGGDTLKDFAFAMLVGVVTGAYSSIFIAAPLLTVLKEREPRYAQLRARAGREAGGRPLRAVPSAAVATAAAATANGEEGEPARIGAAAATSATARGGQASRPRPKARRRPPPKRKRR
jgi:preprotein translocase subunit SecF